MSDEIEIQVCTGGPVTEALVPEASHSTQCNLQNTEMATKEGFSVQDSILPQHVERTCQSQAYRGARFEVEGRSPRRDADRCTGRGSFNTWLC